MHLRGTGLAQHRHQALRGGAANQRIIHYDYPFARQHFADRAVLQPHLEVSSRLRGLDEGAAHIVVADQPELEGDAGLLGEAEGGGVRGIRNRNDRVRFRWLLDGELSAERPPSTIHGLAPQPGIRAGEVHQFEDAWRLRCVARQRPQLRHFAVPHL